MTKRRLLLNLILTAIYLLSLLAFAAANKFEALFPPALSLRLYELEKDFSTLLISLAAAYLSYCFQKRVAFLAALRDMWHLMIEAKNEIVAVTHSVRRDPAAFNDAHKTLSKAIDSMRSVYRNVGEDGVQIGWFPFEPLHDMRRELDALWSGTQDRETTRDNVIDRWNALRAAFLVEFATPEPERPITNRNESDSRRRT